jgi:hypothetical protein
MSACAAVVRTAARRLTSDAPQGRRWLARRSMVDKLIIFSRASTTCYRKRCSRSLTGAQRNGTACPHTPHRSGATRRPRTGSGSQSLMRFPKPRRW